MRVLWDRAKVLANQRKHGLSLEDAARLFTSGADYVVVFDEAHSLDEDRFIAVGPIASGIIVVVWAEGVLRLISARWATERERNLYRSHLGRKS